MVSHQTAAAEMLHQKSAEKRASISHTTMSTVFQITLKVTRKVTRNQSETVHLALLLSELLRLKHQQEEALDYLKKQLRAIVADAAPALSTDAHCAPIWTLLQMELGPFPLPDVAEHATKASGTGTDRSASSGDAPQTTLMANVVTKAVPPKRGSPPQGEPTSVAPASAKKPKNATMKTATKQQDGLQDKPCVVQNEA
jgi:hypothetical protein